MTLNVPHVPQQFFPTLAQIFPQSVLCHLCHFNHLFRKVLRENRTEKDPGKCHQCDTSDTLLYLPGPVPCVPLNSQTACDDRFRAGPLREIGHPPGFMRGRVGPAPGISRLDSRSHFTFFRNSSFSILACLRIESNVPVAISGWFGTVTSRRVSGCRR